ncbi:MAG: hypothetical protein EBR09_16300 [Proteobacteria bacterium]|nr:hypothetical protein [Pseudomonadota bacterium]
MGDVVSFKGKKGAGVPAKGKPRKSVAAKPQKTEKASRAGTAPAAAKPKNTKNKETMNAESIKLWWISQEFDELIRKAVLEKHIPVEELSAVMAHRLGSLLVVSDRTPELTLFCMKIISKITNQKSTGSNAS